MRRPTIHKTSDGYAVLLESCNYKPYDVRVTSNAIWFEVREVEKP